MPRKQRTVIKGTDPRYHSDLPRRPIEEATPKPEPQKEAKPVDAVAKPAPKKAAPKPKAKTAKPPAPAPKPVAAKPKAVAQPSDTSKVATREIHLSAAVKRVQQSKIEALAEKGIDSKIPVRLAGRKAVQQFEPRREFIEKAEADRMPLRDGYHSTKRVEIDLIDKLRKENDPYGLQSDTAMLRGQFEPLFWQCLDEVLEELSSK